MSDFFQAGPVLKNQYEGDLLLRQYLKYKLPSEVLAEIEPGLMSFGERVVTDVRHMGQEAEANPPRHVPFDPWGRRIDQIQVSPAWEQLHQVSAEEGLVAIGYERNHGPFSRLHQFAKLFLFHPSSAFYSCPLAMTDGAARVLELHGSDDLKSRAFKNLISRNPQRFWTSGQWMTERTGGSDVSGTMTLARPESAGASGGWRLSGEKWFTSATTSQMAMALARVEGDTQGSRGLSLFYVELRDVNGKLQNIEIQRLKEKLGTQALPTAELRMREAPAQLVGPQGGGVRTVATLLNITRLYNSVCALAQIQRGLASAKDYARKRSAFGKLLSDQPLHVQTLAQAQVDYEACFHLVFHLVDLLGREETNQATPAESAILRLLTPVVKLWTGRQAVALSSEVLESFGGAGYIEDTGLPRPLRDAQVFPIWEGTTNVLSLDLLRAAEKEGALSALLEDVEARIERVQGELFRAEVAHLRNALLKLKPYLLEHFQIGPSQPVCSDPDGIAAGARALAFSLAQLFAASLLLEFASVSAARKQRSSAVDVARRFCQRDLVSLLPAALEHREQSQRIVWG